MIEKFSLCFYYFRFHSLCCIYSSDFSRASYKDVELSRIENVVEIVILLRIVFRIYQILYYFAMLIYLKKLCNMQVKFCEIYSVLENE